MMNLRDESTEKILVVQVTGEVNDEDYQTVLIPEIQKIKDTNGEIRVVIYFDENFTGYTMGAMVDDAVFGMKNLLSFKKISVIGTHGWIDTFVSFAQTIAPSVVKKFTFEEMSEALAWADKK